MNLDLTLYRKYREEKAKKIGGIGEDYDYGVLKLKDLSDHQDGEHYTDLGKLPNHPTFSDESKYSSPKFRGGKWVQDEKGNDIFIPSKDMMDAGSGKDIEEYFKEFEPDAKVQYPPYKTPKDYYKKNIKK